MRQFPNETAADFLKRKEALKKLPGENNSDYARRIVKVNKEAALEYAARKKAGEDRMQLWRKMQTFDEWFEALPEEEKKANQEQWRSSAEKEMKPFFDRLRTRLDETRSRQKDAYGLDREQLASDRSQITDSAKINETAYERSVKREQDLKKQNQDDFLRLTGYAKSDTAKALSELDRGFAKSLTEAATAYGERGLAASGLQAGSNALMREERDIQAGDIWDNFKRGFAENQIALARENEQTDFTLEGMALEKQGDDLQTKSKLDDIGFARRQLEQRDAANAAAYRYDKEDVESDRIAAVKMGETKNKVDYWKSVWQKQLNDSAPGSGRQLLEVEPTKKPMNATPEAPSPTSSQQRQSIKDRKMAAIEAAKIKRGQNSNLRW